METATGKWIADLILSQIDDLAERVAAVAQQKIPLYAAMDSEAVKQLFLTSYQVQAQTFAQGDMAPLRAYMEPTISARIRAGADAASLITLVTILHDGVRARIEQERATNPARVTEALRQVDMVNKNLRLLFSEINIRVLTQRADPPGTG